MTWREQVHVEWTCDGCDVTARDLTTMGDRPNGWTTEGDFDYCPGCTA